MKISRRMNLGQLAELMGDPIPNGAAEIMRNMLVVRYDGQDTRDIPDAAWDNLFTSSCGNIHIDRLSFAPTDAAISALAALVAEIRKED